MRRWRRSRMVAVMVLLIGVALAVRDGWNRRSVAQAATAAAEKQVAVRPHAGKNEDPSLVRGADGAYWLVWFSDRGGESHLWMTRSNDGNDWQEPWQITSGKGEDYYPSLIQKKDGTFAVTWFRQTNWMGVRNILFATGDKAGKNWSTPVDITKESKNNWAPSLIEDSKGVLWIAWGSDNGGNKDLYLVKSEDGGKIWSPAKRIIESPDEDDFPYLAQEPSGAYLLVWTRFRQQGWFKTWLPNSTGATMLSRSKDGAAWSAPQALTNDKFVDAFPIIYKDLSGQKLFAAWTTDRYTKLGDLAGMTLSETMKYPATPFQINHPDTHGYTARLAPMKEPDRYLMVWVSKNEKGELQIFRQFVSGGKGRPGSTLSTMSRSVP